MLKIECVLEHNGNDSLVYAANYPGAYARGKVKDEALLKIAKDVASYCKWANLPFDESTSLQIIQEKKSSLQIADADSDVLLNTEMGRLSIEEYHRLKSLVLKSAKDFLEMYESIPDFFPNEDLLKKRKTTFYGVVPITPSEMYEHTKNVNAYYFNEIQVNANNEGTILDCRIKGFELLEKDPSFLQNKVFCGSYSEMWSLKKVMRRFIWHDRIHAKAMLRMAKKAFPLIKIKDPYFFDI